MVPYMREAVIIQSGEVLLRSSYWFSTASAKAVFGHYGPEVAASRDVCNWLGDNACAFIVSFCLHLKVSVSIRLETWHVYDIPLFSQNAIEINIKKIKARYLFRMLMVIKKKCDKKCKNRCDIKTRVYVILKINYFRLCA